MERNKLKKSTREVEKLEIRQANRDELSELRIKKVWKKAEFLAKLNAALPDEVNRS